MALSECVLTFSNLSGLRSPRVFSQYVNLSLAQPECVLILCNLGDYVGVKSSVRSCVSCFVFIIILFTGCPSKHVSNISCQHSVTPFSLTQPLFIHSSSDSRTLRIPHIKTKTFWHRSFSQAAPSVWNCQPHELDVFSQLLHLKLPLRLICSNSTSTS